MKKSVLMFCVLALLVVSCNKDNDSPVQLLESISYDGKLAYKFEYDEQDRISKISEYHSSGEINVMYSLTYNSFGDLVSQKRELFSNPDVYGIFTFVKNGNKISIDGNDNWYVELNAQGLPVREINRGLQIILTQHETYTYEYQNGNLNKMTCRLESIVLSNTTTTTYTYDNKKSPFYGCNTPKWWYMFWKRRSLIDFFDLKNNRITESTKDPLLPEDEKITYTYTYDNAGYPLTREDIYRGLTTYTYIKK